MTEPEAQPAREVIREPVLVHTGSLIPTAPQLVQFEGDLADDQVYRRFMARNAASQTLSLQRTEWYARSVRLYVQFWFWLTLIGAVAAIILMIVLVNHTGTATPTSPADPFAP